MLEETIHHRGRFRRKSGCGFGVLVVYILTLETIGYSLVYCDEYCIMGPSGRFTHGLLYWIVGTGYIQVMYPG